MNKAGHFNNERMHLLILQLADGESHSGESLGKLLGVSRAAVWKSIKLLEDCGIEIERVRGKGYRIRQGLSLLDKEVIQQYMEQSARQFYQSIYLFSELDSTNQFLLDLSDSGQADYASVCLAERQLSGRGRRGRKWVSPFGKNLYCSVLWRFRQPLAALEGLSLVVALSIYKVLEEQGYHDIGLKWPNDILSQSKKLAGILLEVRGDLIDFCDVVIGFGINVDMPGKSGQAIDQAWTDLFSLSGKSIDRNILLAAILNQLAQDLLHFEQQGFSAFQEAWNERDGLKGQAVTLLVGQDAINGVVRGVDEKGALLLENEGVMCCYHGGEVSVRTIEETT